MATQIYAQKKSITGKVVDEKGETLPGVNVIEKGVTSNGTLTNASGNYAINVAGPKSILVFSYIGYDTQEITVNAATVINVKLLPKNSDLEEVVVIGYSSVKKASLTGSVSSVTSKDIASTKNEDIVNDLAGKLPGLRVQQNSAEPGAYNNTIDIRGYTYTGNGVNSPPLFIIDGVPQGSDVFQRLTPQDVESISILKDASAAVYGVQAANGVIIVTTRKGVSGQVSITYDVTATNQIINRQPVLANAAQWMTLTNQRTMHNIGNPTLSFPLATIAQFQDGTIPSADWVGATMNNHATMWTHTLTASGGNDNTKYYISFGYLNQNGFYKTNDDNYQRYSFRSNVESKITKRLTFNLQLAGSFDGQWRPGQGGPTGSMWRNVPIDPIYVDAANTLYENPGNDTYGNLNTVALITKSVTGYNHPTNNKFQGGMSLTYDIPYIKGLKAKIFANYNWGMSDNRAFNKLYTVYNINPLTPPVNGNYPIIGSQATGGSNGNSQLTDNYNSGFTNFLQYSLSYNHSFSKHNISALLLYEQTNTGGNSINTSVFEPLNTDQLNQGTKGTGVLVSGNQSDPTALQSLVGTVHYDYASKYLIDFTIRRDGSNFFSPIKQYGVFPGVTAAYRISEEPFFKNLSALSFIDNLKIRGGYAELGDKNGANGYPFLIGYNYPAGGNTSGAVYNSTYVSGLTPRALPYYNLSWYTARTASIGLDADLWKGGLEITADYYNRNRYGLIATLQESIPTSIGANLPQQNLNSDQTRGYELSLGTNQRIGEVAMHVSGNVSYARTKWLNYVAAPKGSTFADWANTGPQTGRYTDVWFGYGYTGQFQSFSQIRSFQPNGGYNVGRGTLPGDYIYQDWNNDGYFDGGDLHAIGATNQGGGNSANSPALVNYGLNITASYKHFDFSAEFQGGAVKWIAEPFYYSYPMDHNGNTFALFVDDWHPVDPTANPYDPNTAWASGKYAYPTGGPVFNQQALGPGGIVNVAYVRLKTIELGYTLSNKQTAGVFKSLRIFANAYDILTITSKNINGIDPEYPTDGLATGYPLDHKINLGLSAKF